MEGRAAKGCLRMRFYAAVKLCHGSSPVRVWTENYFQLKSIRLINIQ